MIPLTMLGGYILPSIVQAVSFLVLLGVRIDPQLLLLCMGRPVQGAKVWVWPFTFGRLGGWPPAGMQVTPSDDAGRYTISGLPALGSVWVSTAQTWGDAFRAPYVHQCVTAVTVESDATLDITITSTANLGALNASTRPPPPNSRVVSGTVFEITADGRQPVRNVWVGWEASVMDGVVAETRTDAAGHYRLCGLPREQITLSAAPAYGNVFYAIVGPGSDVIVDVERRAQVGRHVVPGASANHRR